MRFDRGVENSLIAEAQVALRMNHSDNLAGAGSVWYGSSPTNSVYKHACMIAIIIILLLNFREWNPGGQSWEWWRLDGGYHRWRYCNIVYACLYLYIVYCMVMYTYNNYYVQCHACMHNNIIYICYINNSYLFNL